LRSKKDEINQSGIKTGEVVYPEPKDIKIVGLEGDLDRAGLVALYKKLLKGLTVTKIIGECMRVAIPTIATHLSGDSKTRDGAVTALGNDGVKVTTAKISAADLQAVNTVSVDTSSGWDKIVTEISDKEDSIIIKAVEYIYGALLLGFKYGADDLKAYLEGKFKAIGQSQVSLTSWNALAVDSTFCAAVQTECAPGSQLSHDTVLLAAAVLNSGKSAGVMRAAWMMRLGGVGLFTLEILKEASKSLTTGVADIMLDLASTQTIATTERLKKFLLKYCGESKELATVMSYCKILSDSYCADLGMKQNAMYCLILLTVQTRLQGSGSTNIQGMPTDADTVNMAQSIAAALIHKYTGFKAEDSELSDLLRSVVQQDVERNYREPPTRDDYQFQSSYQPTPRPRVQYPGSQGTLPDGSSDPFAEYDY
jgi:hypothetical protein